METYIARSDREIVGFLTLKPHNDRSTEVQVMAIPRRYHRMGVGATLLLHAETELRRWGVEPLHVKTLGPSRPDKSYEKTRRFYEAMGFVSIEETTAIWGPSNPCLMMVKQL